MTDRGLFLGRFQPFHRGHLDVVRRLCELHDEVVIGIGSANVSHSSRNPFTAGERIVMVRDACREAGLDAVLPVTIPDVGRNAIWAAHVMSMTPQFSTLYTNNPLPARLFHEAGRRVAPAPFFERERFEGTSIRAAMLADEAWESLVPPAVARVIRDLGLLARIRDLAVTDGAVEGTDPTV